MATISNPTNTINGIIYDAFETPLTGVTVQAYDQDLRSTQLLGQAVTDATGTYLISYTASQYTDSEYQTADVFIKVLNSTGTVLGQSPVSFNVPSPYTLNYKVGNAPIKGQAEFDLLVQKIKPLTDPQKVALTDLQENDKFQDISFLAAETGEDSNRIALLPLAYTCAGSTKIAADIFYGLMRLQFPTDLNSLLLVKSASIVKGIQSAIAQNIISARWASQTDAIIKQLNALAANHILSDASAAGQALSPILAAALPDPALQQTFVSTYLVYEDTPDQFWDALAKQNGFTDPKLVAGIQKALQLSILTGNQPALTTLLYKEQQQNPALDDISGFAGYTVADWSSRITRLVKSGAITDFPAGIAGDTPEAKTAAYADALASSMKTVYPLATFAGQLAKDTGDAFKAAQADLATFFKNNSSYNLKNNNINTVLKEANLTGISNTDTLRQELTTINRLYKLTDEYSHLSALRLDGIDSATALVGKYTADQFAGKYADVMTADTAAAVYRKAQQANNRSTVLALGLKMRNNINVYAINGEAGDASPDYESMFGDTNCDCEECQSVYAPSAYFVDILNTLRQYQQPAYNQLTTRRPDLIRILLTCANTNTPLPYIDLVNELLENLIAPLAPVVVNGIETYPQFQTNSSAAELKAYPQNVNTAAYEPLKTAHSAGNLPLDLPLAETRLYLNGLGTDRYRLMEAFYGNKPGLLYNALPIVIEYLQLSWDELSILNGATPISIQLADVPTFLTATGLSYIEMLQLLECYFINPPAQNGKRSIEVVSVSDDATSCNIEDLKLQSADAQSLKVIPFIRLWKKLGWDIFDLDRAFTALGITDLTGDINTSLVIPLSHIQRLKTGYHLSIADTLSLLASLDTGVYIDHSQEGQPQLPSLYATLFQNKQITNLPDPVFADPTALTGTLAASAGTITAALNLSQSDFNKLTAAPITDGQLNLTNLGILYRYTVLARALNLTIDDLLNIISILGSTPFNGITDTAGTLIFADRAALVSTSGFTLAGLSGLLLGSVYAAPVTDNVAIAKVLSALQDGLQKIEKLQPAGNTPAEQAANKLASQTSLINDTLATAFKTDAQTTAILTGTLVKSSANPASTAITPFVDEAFISAGGPLFTIDAAGNTNWTFPDVYNTCVQLSNTWTRLNTLLARLKISSDEFVYFQLHESRFNLTGLWTVPQPADNQFTQFERLYKLILFRNALPATNGWFHLFDPVVNNPADAKQLFADALVKLTGFDAAQITFLLGALADVSDKGALLLNFPDDYTDGKILLNVISCVNITMALGSTAADVSSLALDQPTANQENEAAILARNLLKAKYDDATWLTTIGEMSDQLRTLRRDALLSYILTTDDATLAGFRQANRITDVNSLYACLLIDLEMDSCMLTSRIKQAISTVQLFVDRCLLGLETGIALPDDFTTQWETWRKQYRVWEANREIFLYPENWVDPGLRDDQSPFFQDLKTALNQNNVTADTVADALMSYLQSVDTVANLEIAGLYPDALTGMVHVIGRTRNLPRQYYYTRQANNLWQAWQKIEMDIQGDHILPVVWNNRLMLFWAVFTEKQENTSDGFLVPKAGDVMPPPPTYLEMTLYWTEYKDGIWSSKSQSEDIFSTEPILLGTFRPKATDFTLSSAINNTGQLDIRLFAPYRTDYPDEPLLSIGGYLFDGCHSAPTLYSAGNLFDGVFKIAATDADGMFIEENSGRDSFAVYNTGLYLPVLQLSANSETTLFNNTPGTYQVLPNHHQIEVVKPVSFFYSNGVNNFYVNTIQRPIVQFPVNGLPVSGSLLDRGEVSPVGGISVQLNQQQQIKAAVGLQRRAIAISGTTTAGATAYFTNIFLKTYAFQTFYHPYVCELIKTLNTDGIDGLYKNLVLDSDGILKDGIQNRLPQDIFASPGSYDPTGAVHKPYPVEQVDFSSSSLYSIYNWELFFHIPLLIATSLSKNNQFEDARKWFHYIFDPTRPAGTSTGVDRFWITQPFKKEIANGILPIEQLLNSYSADLDTQLSNWEQHPFNPHAVARLRISAYMRTTVMKYIDNLIAWGDNLFTQDTLETINEATLLYIMAANLLGNRPQEVPPRAVPQLSTFADIMNSTNSFNNAKVAVQSFFSPSDAPGSTIDNVMMPLFCIPKNGQLLAYWDTVADRLFKIRHCQNIEGVFQQLPLFEPPINPALLIGATAAGVDLSSVISGSYTLPNYRFQVLLQKATELCSDVRALGSLLIAALEKSDAEQLALIHSGHELALLNAMRDLKTAAVDEAGANLDSLINSRAVTQARQEYYSSRPFINVSEAVYFATAPLGLIYQNMQIGSQALAAIGFSAPQVTIGPFSSGATYGGDNIGHALTVASASFGQLANLFNTTGTLANVIGSFQRRKDEWDFQAQSATLELAQIDKQIAAARLHLNITQQDLQHHDLQIQQSGEVDNYLRSKFNNADLYDYMADQIAAVYFQSYQLAYTTARKAQKCMEYELGLENTGYIQYGYWDSRKKGLLSGEKLQYDLRRLEQAYLDQNTRELEIVKNVSLAVVNPQALLQLRETGSCTVTLPEELFDLDFAGHYFRRIKSVSMSVPCIVGPYTSVNATLRLTANEYRINNSLPTGSYAKVANDTRFRTAVNTVSAIATSSAQNDSGVFELNFRDERYLPFEGSGAASSWTIELPSDEALRQFDYKTISDIILHIKYTARDGGAAFKTAAVIHLQQLINNLAGSGLPQAIVIDVKRDDPNAWYPLISATSGDATLQLSITKDRLPFFTRNKNVRSAQVKLFARKTDRYDTTPITVNGSLSLVPDANNLFSAVITNTPTDITAGSGLSISATFNAVDVSKIDNLFLLLIYSFV